MKKSALQSQIEKKVSNGLMFYSETDFYNSGSIYDGLVDLDKVKNSEEGLRAHLYGLWKSGEDDKDVSRYLDSSKLSKMWISFCLADRETRYERNIRKAVDAEGKRNGSLSLFIKKKVSLPCLDYSSRNSDE